MIFKSKHSIIHSLKHWALPSCSQSRYLVHIRVFICRSGLSFDYSFWSSLRCYNETKTSDYTCARLCNTYIKDTKDTPVIKEYCPNSNDGASCTNVQHYFCEKSRTCIEKIKLCDGIFHCLWGEDEQFDICKNTFPEAATIKCIEADRPPWINITILAIPCNGERECLDVNDENCESNWYITFGTMIIFFILISFSWFYIHFSTGSPRNKFFELHEHIQLTDERNETNFKLKGDDLAKLKVLHSIYICTLTFYITCISRMKLISSVLQNFSEKKIMVFLIISKIY